MDCEKYEDGRAFYELGVCCEMGYGTRKDIDRSTDYYIKSLLCGEPRVDCKRPCLKKAKDTIIEENRSCYDDVKRRSSEGDSLCQAIEGYCFILGVFEKQDYSRAFELFKKSSDGGDCFGQLYLGYCYRYGYGVDKDVSKAARYYEKAAKQGNSDAQFELGWLFCNGEGVPQDY